MELHRIPVMPDKASTCKGEPPVNKELVAKLSPSERDVLRQALGRRRRVRRTLSLREFFLFVCGMALLGSLFSVGIISPSNSAAILGFNLGWISMLLLHLIHNRRQQALIRRLHDISSVAFTDLFKRSQAAT